MVSAASARRVNASRAPRTSGAGKRASSPTRASRDSFPRGGARRHRRGRRDAGSPPGLDHGSDGDRGHGGDGNERRQPCGQRGERDRSAARGVREGGRGPRQPPGEDGASARADDGEQQVLAEERAGDLAGGEPDRLEHRGRLALGDRPGGGDVGEGAGGRCERDEAEQAEEFPEQPAVGRHRLADLLPADGLQDVLRLHGARDFIDGVGDADWAAVGQPQADDFLRRARLQGHAVQQCGRHPGQAGRPLRVRNLAGGFRDPDDLRAYRGVAGAGEGDQRADRQAGRGREGRLHDHPVRAGGAEPGAGDDERREHCRPGGGHGAQFHLGIALPKRRRAPLLQRRRARRDRCARFPHPGQRGQAARGRAGGEVDDDIRAVGAVIEAEPGTVGPLQEHGC